MTSEEAVDVQLVALIAEIAEVDPASVRPSARLADDVGLDSIALIELMVALGLQGERLTAALEMKWQNATVRDLEGLTTDH